MPLDNKLIILFILLTLLFIFSSGCLLEEIFGEASFSLNSYKVINDEGFPALLLNFKCRGRANLKTYNSNLNQIDYDFFYSDSEANLNIGNYRETIEGGSYSFKVYDKNDKVIFEKELIFNGTRLTIIFCDQYWWENNEDFTLIGLKMSIQNNGDTPGYPYYADVIVGSKVYPVKVLPSVILPGTIGYTYCSIIHEGVFSEESFQVVLKDKDEETIALKSFNFNVEGNVVTFEYNYGLDNTLSIPYPDFLYNYYSSVERIIVEDYSVFILDEIDDTYLDYILSRIIKTCDFGEFRFNLKSDAEKVEYIASFIQGLDYKKDSDYNESYEYPRYPVETLFNDLGGGDCEDKSILTASLIHKLGYEVALLRLPDHMAVGVKIDNNGILKKYNFYTEDYYYLETTTPNHKCGYIPNSFSNPSELYVYPIEQRSFVIHNWKEGHITKITGAEQGDFVKVVAIVENLGNKTAENVNLKGVFYSEVSDFALNSNKVFISEIGEFDKKKVVFSILSPTGIDARFESQIIIDGLVIDTERSESSFSK